MVYRVVEYVSECKRVNEGVLKGPYECRVDVLDPGMPGRTATVKHL